MCPDPTLEHLRQRGWCRGDPITVRTLDDLRSPLPQDVEIDDSCAGRRDSLVEQPNVSGQHVVHDRVVEHIREVLGFHRCVIAIAHHRQPERHLGHRGGQVELFGRHTVEREPDRALACRKAQSDNLFETIATRPIRVQLAHHPVDTDMLVTERTESGVASGCDEVCEGGPGVDGRPHQHRVAEVPDRPVGPRLAPVGDGHGHQEVRRTGVPVDQRSEGCQQHCERRCRGRTSELVYRLDHIGGHRPGTAACILGRDTGCLRRQFEPFRSRAQQVSPVCDRWVVDFGGHRIGCHVEELDRLPVCGSPVIGRIQVVEEDRPRVVVPADVVDDKDEHPLVAGGSNQCRPHQHVPGEVERPPELTSCEHFETARATLLHEIGQVVFTPGHLDVLGSRLVRDPIVAHAVGGAQDLVASDHVG